MVAQPTILGFNPHNAFKESISRMIRRIIDSIEKNLKKIKQMHIQMESKNKFRRVVEEDIEEEEQIEDKGLEDDIQSVDTLSSTRPS